MEKHFKAIVENGYQFLQTPGGERINYITKTTITQGTDKIGKCIFSLNVNFKGELRSCQYDLKTKQFTTLGGEVLDVEIVEYQDKNGNENLTVGCTIIFPYETNHEKVLASYPTF